MNPPKNKIKYIKQKSKNSNMKKYCKRGNETLT